MIDIHCHILPGVDDGSKDMKMSLDMARLASQNGINTIIVTPHNNIIHHCASPDGIRRRVAELQEACYNEGIKIVFYPGNELYFDSTLPDRLAHGEALTLADSNYCLVEFSPNEIYTYILSALSALQDEGFSPILAHCERYLCILDQPNRAEELVRHGILLQSNAAVVPPKMFAKPTAFVNNLLKKELLSFISTDAHRAEGPRSPEISAAVKHLKKKYRPGYVVQILETNASELIING